MASVRADDRAAKSAGSRSPSQAESDSPTEWPLSRGDDAAERRGHFAGCVLPGRQALAHAPGPASQFFTDARVADHQRQCVGQRTVDQPAGR